MNIQGVNAAAAATNASSLSSPTPAVDGAKPGGFKNLMLEAIDHVNSMQQQADKAVETLVTGGDANPAEVLTALQKADMSFKMMMQIRNKLVQAYQEVNNVRI